MRDQRLSIEFALGNELQHFFAVATVNTAGLEDQFFAVSAADCPIIPAAAKALFYVIERTRMSAIRCAACPSP